MKRLSLTLLTLLCFMGMHAQKVIKNPSQNYSTAPGLSIDQIQLNETSTAVSISYKGRPGASFNIPKKTYICDVNEEDKKLYIQSCDGLNLGKWVKIPESGTFKYTLHFAALGDDVKAIDLREEFGGWHIYDIQLSGIKEASLIPDNMQGVWYNKIGGDLNICLYNKEAFYKGKHWTYGDVSIDKKGNGFIELKNNEGGIKLLVNRKKGKAKYTITNLYPLETYWEEEEEENSNITSRSSKASFKYPRGKDGELLIGESIAEMTTLCDSKKEVVFWGIAERDFPLNSMKFNKGSSIYSGCISAYKKRYGELEILVHVNNILTGSQDEYSAKVGDGGLFSVEVPMLHGNIVYVRSKAWNGSVYLEPGQQVFQILGKGNPKYLGELGRVNNELFAMRNLNSRTYQEVLKKVLNMSVKEFVDFHQFYLEKDLTKLDAFVKKNYISPKAEQIKRYDLIYMHNSAKFEYKWKYDQAYRKKHDIPRKQRDLGVDIPKYTKEEVSFIDNALVNDSMALIGGSYSSFINRIKYFSFFGILHYKYGDVYNIANGVKKYGYELTNEEEALIDSLAPYQDVFKELDIFMESDANTRFVRKYHKELRNIYRKTKGKHKPEELPQLLKDEGATLDAVDEGFCNDKLTLFNRPDVEYAQEHRKKYADEIKAFTDKYKKLDKRLNVDAKIEFRDNGLKENFGVEPGFAADIMTSQDILRKVVNEYEPLAEEDLGYRLEHISNPFVQQYIQDTNQEVIAKIEENKKNGTVAVNEMPEVEDNTELFDAIMAKYKGKVVYVDFWATWCSPCRSGIKKIAPLKAQMADEDVVFVYLSAASSPQGAYMNMLPEIKGEHYKCTQEQWDALCKQFDVAGIPHYVLVDKNGKVAKNNFRLHNNQAIKQLINKYL
ncbi:TlpA family protein disulfide reductase [Labilibacter marinus]|uniref:TlpA family protein disulfide reductase n=1 Tax=Labilibacter marinus TaxID=1477105 RepID=UPI0009F9754F|nr:TlpA disulfide reductase family protein [Labilibacter marinus]